MTDVDLVLKKLAFIEICVADLNRLARPERIELDIREERFVEHTLQVAIQAALDVASHIVSGDRLGEPETKRALFEQRVLAGWVPERLGPVLGDMAGFRNILVYDYQAVDPAAVRDIVEQHLDDLLGYVAAVRTRLSGLGND